MPLIVVFRSCTIAVYKHWIMLIYISTLFHDWSVCFADFLGVPRTVSFLSFSQLVTLVIILSMFLTFFVLQPLFLCYHFFKLHSCLLLLDIKLFTYWWFLLYNSISLLRTKISLTQLGLVAQELTIAWLIFDCFSHDIFS